MTMINGMTMRLAMVSKVVENDKAAAELEDQRRSNSAAISSFVTEWIVKMMIMMTIVLTIMMTMRMMGRGTKGRQKAKRVDEPWLLSRHIYDNIYDEDDCHILQYRMMIVTYMTIYDEDYHIYEDIYEDDCHIYDNI